MAAPQSHQGLRPLLGVCSAIFSIGESIFSGGLNKLDHKLGSLKQHTLVYLRVLEARIPKWVSLGSSQGLGRAVFLLEA